MKLGEKLKAIRAAEGLSQNEFCEVIDLSINTLRKYETGGMNLVVVLWLKSPNTRAFKNTRYG